VAQKLIVRATRRQALCRPHALRGAEAAYADFFLAALWWHIPDRLTADFASGTHCGTSGDVPMLGVRTIYGSVNR
jgi:hypothetical protein